MMRQPFVILSCSPVSRAAAIAFSETQMERTEL